MSFKPKKQGVGKNKQFGPIQKLTVPDFQHISNQYEMMQNEILEKPTGKRREIKNFSIRKANHPNRMQASADQGEESMMNNGLAGDHISPRANGKMNGHQNGLSMKHNNENSLLTKEEQEALKPKDVKVVNPWIYEQTHQEYLENIKGLPARHANVIKKHHVVVKEQTFLQKTEIIRPQDEATKEAVALLDKENEIFTPADLPSTKVLTRFDTWDEAKTVDQWLEECLAKPGQAHALSPVYQGYEYCWKPVEVYGFDQKEKKYMVRVCASGQEKLVTRLSLLFFTEDPEKFKDRVNECKSRQQVVESELRFTNLVDSVPTDQVSTLSKERRFYFLHKSMRPSDKFDPSKIYPTFKTLLKVVEEEYIRQMKKCVITAEMEDSNNFEKFQRMKIPIRLSKKTIPFFGVERCPTYNLVENRMEIQSKHFSADDDLVIMTRIFIQKCIDFEKERYLQTNKQVLKLPRELKDLEKIQSTHHDSVSLNMQAQWRDFLIGEIQDKLRKNNHNFFEANMENYQRSMLKRIIARFEYILNTYLRQFVRTSIDEYVDFIRHFTIPKESEGELWPINKEPLMVIHLSLQKKAKGKKGDKAKKAAPKEVKEGAKEGEVAEAEQVVEEEEEDEKNRVVYSPSIQKCSDFILRSMDWIENSTNKLSVIEVDLMPFLFTEKEDRCPNFKIDKQFPWIRDATENLTQLIGDNVDGPNELLSSYSKYDYILNIDRKELVDSLFKSGADKDRKVALEEIRKEVQHYDQAHYEIMTLSGEEVNFRVFRVVAKKLRGELADQALKTRERILDATYNYCNETTNEVKKAYIKMMDKINHESANERELIDTKDFIAAAPAEVEKLQAILKTVYEHHLMLEEFSYMYKEQDLESYWLTKIWPLRIQAALTDGKNMIAEKNELFNSNLEKEKDKFQKDIQGYEAAFATIKSFTTLAQASAFSTDAYTLHENILNAFEKKKQFNEREEIFNQPLTLYPELESLRTDFKPFFELTTMAYTAKTDIAEWTNNQLLRQDPNQIASSVAAWANSCFQLNKKLNEEYPEVGEVAQELRGTIEAFSKNLPLIRCFTSEAITDEDWREVQEAVAKSETLKDTPFEREDIKISDIETHNLFAFTEDIEDITMRAEKKYSLAKKLKELKDSMKIFELEQADYKNGVTFLVKGWDLINMQLDDQTVSTQAMLGSSFMRGRLKNETRAWEQKLNHMSELMEEVLKVQKTWMYLEPIFSSGDIGTTMPLEYKMFVEVDTHWKATMLAIEVDPGIIDFAEKENVMQHFQEASRKLDKITKSLNDYLEQKRLVFARFFFLANDDLLQILAQTKNPQLVQAHMDKCFEGIAKVRFNAADNVLGMISAEKEEVTFLKPIDVNEGARKGNVELWMLDIEAAMIACLRVLAKDSLVAYPNAERTEWSKMYPGQIVLAISQIYWTTEVEKALQDGMLQEYWDVQQSQIEAIVQMVREPLDDMVRITLKALVVIDVHARDVVQRLIDLNIENPADFEWTAQLRYYWEEKDTLRVKMVTAIIPYAYEYLGNSPRLVITQLTDRCYRTLLGAKYLNYGGAPEGPAGTGKTESVKDLAKAIAVQCVVFNCSDGLDYLAMAKFFKGLAASGAWCCFDEFNRIDLEVLSVIAQQIQCIQTAVKNLKITTFTFEKTELKLNRSCAVNITMNPGYAGRSELPDNLKALFRPCAMMVPDYALIAQIELYSFGFSEAAPLSVKVVASLRLSSEQLSSQAHYDFGMRAVKSILTACGNQRRILADWPEDQICLKGLNDVNIPKFTSNDVPLFNGITSDLFPGIKLPEQDYKELAVQMLEACVRNNLQPTEIFLEKCVQLYETLMVRHGLMVVGEPYAGKSSVIKVLQQAMSNVKDDPKFVNVLTEFVNPKAITQNQLYGVFDGDTQEWSDGVLAIKIRECAGSETPDRKWIIFDGPVDAVWIENMNTVLDDNKKLCLTSGAIIKLKPTMTIMFQVDDLSEASPATISRCGMVLLEAAQLGHSVYVDSYANQLKMLQISVRNEAKELDRQPMFSAKVCDKFAKNFHYVLDLCAEFTRVNGKFPCAGGSSFLANHMIRLIECYIIPYKPKYLDEEEEPVPGDLDEKLHNALVYAAIWGIGGVLDETCRATYGAFLRELVAGEEVLDKYKIDMGKDGEEKYPPTKIPTKLPNEYESLFDLYFDAAEMRWVPWTQTVPAYKVDKEASYLQLSIPTIDSIRMTGITETLLKSGMHCLLVGPTGTGKSVQLNQLLAGSFDNESWAYYQLGFSAQTSANQTQRIVDGSMDKRRKGVFGPKLGKEGVIFVDDLAMPQPEKYGAQPPIELLRQWMDYKGWYDIDDPERSYRRLEGVRFLGAMGPPAGGRPSISARYIRHFNVVYVEPYDNASLKFIFSTIMDWLFASKASPPFPSAVQGKKDSIVENTILIYQGTMKKFRPTPAKSHYTYNLRDVSKVFQGIAKSSGKAILKEDDIVKLWAHECQRVFQDRLICQADRDLFQVLLKDVLKEQFHSDWDKLVTVEPLLFGSFVPCCHPGGDTKQKPYQDVYCEITDRDLLKKVCDEMLDDFNSMNPNKKMNLVLFLSAMEHVVKINRVVSTEFGHALLMGVGGSGRKSLSTLAVFIATYETFEIEITKAYDFTAWRDDMRQKLFMQCGVDEKQTVFLLNDTQIIMESFLEDVNNILNNGEIPNLYSAQEDIANIMENMREVNKNLPGFKTWSDGDIWADFLRKCKANVHIVLAMSPIGDDFKRRLRMFPSLVNCCSIDYFLPWPPEALETVAQVFLKEIDDLPQLPGIVAICVDMQTRVTELAVKYLAEQKRHYYVTPTSYLVLIQAFKELLDDKRVKIDTVISKYARGIDQLADAKREVGILEGDLQELLPKLQVAKAETAEQIVVVDAKKTEVAEKTKLVEADEAVAKEKKGSADVIQKDCEQELGRVMPIYNLAMRAVGQLKAADITELKGFPKAPPAAVIVVRALVLLYEKPILKKADPDGGSKKVDDWWESGKKGVLGMKDLLGRCKDFKKDDIPPEVIAAVKPIVELPEFNDEVLKKASTAAAGLGKWVRAMVQYDEAMKIVKPKQAQLAGAKEASAAAQALWDAALEKLRAVEAQMKELVDRLDAAEAKKKQLQDEFETAERKLLRANQLISKLKDEEVNWAKSLVQNRAFKECLVGDIIISSGIIAYLGVFTQDYRQEAIQSWVELMGSFEIVSTQPFSLAVVLGNGVKIQKWHLDSLPQEDVAVDNAIIMDNSDRWPLMIDPQMQGNLWIRQMEKDPPYHSIKPTMDPKQVSRVLENCIQLGNPILFEDATEVFDPLLDPLISKQIQKGRGSWSIKLGDKSIDYSKDFKFYITTKLTRPHYPPEVCVKVNMLNFMVTEAGLQDQMLNIVVTHEDPKKMEQRNQIQIQQAADNKKKAELEDLILNQIANNDKNLLEDDLLIETLDDSKRQCAQIEQKQEEAKITLEHINNIRRNFELVARRVARLFFVLIQIMTVDPMYQYSLGFFKDIYRRALKNGDVIEKSKKNDRKNFFIKEFTSLLYDNICRSLFQKDTLLFSFLICLKIMGETEGNLDQREVRFLMTGGTRVEMSKPNPAGEGGFLADGTWAAILQVAEEFPAFKGLDVSFEKKLGEWERVYNSDKPQSKKANWPAPFNSLSYIRQAMLLRILRPDKVIPVIQKLISKEKELGKEYIVPPPFDMERSFLDSQSHVPIIIVLSPGADPMAELQTLAKSKNAKVVGISLGQGQGKIACDAIERAQEHMEWVVLQNCHLCPSFLPTLDGIIAAIEPNAGSNFRIWLTSMPSEKFPVTILQNGVKAAIEPPKGLKNNILRSYLAVDQTEFESCDKPAAYKSLLWGLCFFNALILERRKFGPLGWNIHYEFSNSDLSISQAQLMMFLNAYEKIPWDALRYMVAEANYGGRVTDPNDRVTIGLVLEDFYCPEMLEKNHKLSQSGKYYVPSVGELYTYQDFVREELPLNDLTEIFGLHENAEITSAIGITNSMLAIALALQGTSSSGGSGKSQDEQLKEIAVDILAKVPKNFDTEHAAKRHPLCYEDSLNTVLQQELLRYNKLISEVRASLVNVGRAIKGEVPLSPELEAVCTSLFNNQVPATWHAKSYPSLKPLASWVVDFLDRLAFMSEWVEGEAPKHWWLPGFFFTQSFLTGAKQNFARKYVLAIDQIDFDFIVISDESKYDLAAGPEDGAYVHGLYTEGARWCAEQEGIAESHPKVLFAPMRSIWILPANVKDIDYGHSYKCPVYKTQARKGTLATTGHSTNFVLYIYLPMQKQHGESHWVKRGLAMLTGLSE